jgi:tetratricopeptide (TPR) repeat protein
VGNNINWEAKTGGTRVVLPETIRLSAGNQYRLSVVAVGDQFSSEPQSAVFSLLPEAQAQDLLGAVRRVDQLGMDPDARDYAVAQLLLSQKLYSDVIDLLEKLATGGGHPAAIYRALGDAYFLSDLPNQAVAPYETAASRSDNANDIEGQAAAFYSLGNAARYTGRIQEAKDWLERARSLYESLGDSSGVKAVEDALAALP